jgi:hypothetical protein
VKTNLLALPEPLGSCAAALQVFDLADDEDDVEIILGDLPGKTLGYCEFKGDRRWLITINKKEAAKSPLMACLILVHEWAHYRAHHDPLHFDHLGAWPEEAARAYRLTFQKSA